MRGLVGKNIRLPGFAQKHKFLAESQCKMPKYIGIQIRWWPAFWVWIPEISIYSYPILQTLQNVWKEISLVRYYDCVVTGAREPDLWRNFTQPQYLMLWARHRGENIVDIAPISFLQQFAKSPLILSPKMWNGVDFGLDNSAIGKELRNAEKKCVIFFLWCIFSARPMWTQTMI